MAVREIRLFGDPVLKTECKKIAEITTDVKAHAQDLLDTVTLEGRAGVASNQIGHTLRAFSLNIDGETRVVLNPEIVSLDGEPVLMGEGCLSIPDLWFEVSRYPKATVKGMDVEGRPLIIKGEGLLAQALQHECDHLDGKLYIDRLDRQLRGDALKQIRSSSWF
ncbi:MAG TPA: peptide deformylase [Microbacteriaceae bacterium]|nr:peptide deformylase [Microbacteriaceae bacterium]